jgi:hypothetical protein
MSAIIAFASGIFSIITSLLNIYTKYKETPKKPKLIFIQIFIASGVIVFFVSYVFFYMNTKHEPKICITSVLDSDGITPVNKSSAGFEITLKGSIVDADHRFLCIVVDDMYHKYVQPNAEEIITNTFLKKCYLGIKDDSASINKTYTVFAAVTNREYTEKDATLDPKTVIVSSTPEVLRRTK